MSADLSSELYSTSTVIKLLNMDITKKSAELVGGATGTSFVNPVISFDNSLADSNETLFEDYIWNAKLLNYNGSSYSLKLEKDKVYSYAGKYYRANSNSSVSGSSWVLPSPTDEKFGNHFTEVTKP